MEPTNKRTTVAVIGLGALGLVAVKNLIEEGFRVTGFDGNEFVGGLWHYTDDDRTSVLKTTVINISAERGCYTDFPFPKDAPPHVHAHHVEKYLEDYTDHFQLRPLLRLSTRVKNVSPPGEAGKWAVTLEGTGEVEYFDKVVIATGINQVPVVPDIPGIEQFAGRCLHSRSYKSPEPFKGRKVLIVGFGSTGADTATTLVGYADKIYVSHRNGVMIVPRKSKGVATDHVITERADRIIGLLERFAPRLAERMVNSFLKRLQDSSFTIRPEWKLSPEPSYKESIPIISDEIVRVLEDGSVSPVGGVRAVVAPDTVELSDGTRLVVDTIIYCTGYRMDFGLLDPSVDPGRETTGWADLPGASACPFPKLYRGLFSLDYPDSLAILGCAILPSPAFQLYDVATMVVAQVWGGKSELPPLEEMRRAADEHVRMVCSVAEKRKVLNPGSVDGPEWMAWANNMTGTGVDTHLGWGWKGIKFWLTNWRLCGILMGGVLSPHSFRLFETGKRRRWDGAEEEIWRVNKKVKELREKT
ncbi:related to flavin depend monooxygenase that catalyses the oxidation of rubrofusarin to 9-hydroxyrubrofusarin [Cephalotrichum gorgonifer]|uniref:Related to flavin depend monooxygenase that catalyses the oxidation of rubrofusarin to 9-hydroxyrubrofusarin n=1 Tax=Cephalotrichum gorgonifer TaxID=2041049 RepID=A0AAE8T025_9PEZI|nr:related to flavin depend monooxygenase that catalyses the oxidation of rubrofusarin to 9-hydroxyrubrofusarin [Cephalotrichum gorgonifer]